MTYWIIPANPKIYNIREALHDLKLIDWRQYYNFEVGDIVYIYSSRPESRIIYKMKVTDINLTADKSVADRRYWIDPSAFDVSLNNNRFIRLKPIAENETDLLTLVDLYEHGLRGAPQGAIKLKEPLLSYVIDTL